MKKGKLGNLKELSETKKVYTGEVIDPKSKAPSGVSKGDVILKAAESIPVVIEQVSSAYQSRQQTLQQKEITEQQRVAAMQKIEEFKNSTAQVLSENEKEIQKLKNEDSKSERETKLLINEQNMQRELELKRLETQHGETMKRLDLEGQKLDIHSSSITLLQKMIEVKVAKGEDYSAEQALLAEALQKV